MGSMKSILKMLPSVGPFAGMSQGRRERRRRPAHPRRIHHQLHDQQRNASNADIINGSTPQTHRRSAPAPTVQEVNNLLRQYNQMSKMFKSMGGGMGGGIKAQQRLMSQMQQTKQKFGR